MAFFPNTRLRRTRSQPWIRDLVRETHLTPHDLIWTIVVSDSADPIEPVAAMPGTVRMNVAEAAKAARRARDLGIPAIAVFPHIDPALKDGSGTEALNPDGLVMRAVKAMKDAAPEVGIICDVALDPFTDHGHDGVMEKGVILNDATVDLLVQQSLAQVEAGCDVLAPSDMMDGRIGAIRNALEEAGHTDTLILSYAAKYASGFYGPYRSAIGSAKLQGDKKTYQMDPANSDEALREVAMDIEEGADMVMVKPGLPYLDIVTRVKEAFGVPTYAFQVSGEYAMIMAAAQNGWIDGERVMMETLTCFKRAGADGVLTYFAPMAAEILGE
ncbi:MAG: porphobilinogen synthase [Oceanicaulis sp.]|uniref:porphobilinogen synthase n=1 Tax=Glycocaulis sp. TaxID=1969725 RepID=UPI0025C0920E|nr:porphobilinogen synthase [Glycocaulis sp.]MCC5980270.1 porphobilinogen synthase [Oceanicaulis sp.]MCH8521107.1 porphobilinogen synthase [Glycocaulis sp.]